jgi:hypothetical protein
MCGRCNLAAQFEKKPIQIRNASQSIVCDMLSRSAQSENSQKQETSFQNMKHEPCSILLPIWKNVADMDKLLLLERTLSNYKLWKE